MEAKYLKLTALLIFLLLSGVATFWRDTSDFIFDMYRENVNERESVPKLLDPDLARITAYTIEREKNNNRHLARSNLSIHPLPNGNLSVTLDIESSVHGDDYPSLRVIMYSGNGKATRYTDLSPIEYTHGKSFYKENVSFEVTPVQGESSLDVRPFFKD